MREPILARAVCILGRRVAHFFGFSVHLFPLAGVDVIVAFVSTDISELTQTPARRGKAGTFCMVLAAGQLQSLGTDAAALRRKRPEEQYDDIVAAMRRRCLEDQKKRKEKQVLRARELDASSHALFDALLRADVQSGRAVLQTILWDGTHISETGSGSVLSSATAGAPSRTCDISSSSSRRIERPSTLPERLHFHIEVLWARV